MKIEMIDLEKFFNDKYRNFDNNLGMCATGIITQKQMVTRIMKKEGNDIGTHFETEGSILSDIFGFDKKLFLGFGYNIKMYNELDEAHQKVLGESITITYISNSIGNTISIYLPEEQKSLTSDQMEAIKYLSDYIEEVSLKLNKPIVITGSDRKKEITEINSLRYKIIPFFENFIDDTYEQSIPDNNIVAKKDIKEKTLKK